MSMASCTSPRVSARTLPISRVISLANSSLRWTSNSAARNRISARLGRHEPPRFVGIRGGVHRQVDIFVAGGDKHSHQLVRIRGVTILVGFTGTRFHPFAVDEVLKNPRGNCRGHTSSWLPT